MEESRIIDLYIERDQSAIDQTKERYSRGLVSIAANLLDDMRDVEECESDAYLYAWNNIPPHEPRGYLFSFLARIIRNAALDRVRKAGRQKRSARVVELSSELEQCLAAPSGDDRRVETAELADSINAFLHLQKEEPRNVFIRRYWFCDSISAISKRFGISESKAKSMLLRTRNRLKEHLIKEGLYL